MPLISGARTSLSDYIAQAQQAQPDELKPETGHDLERHAQRAAEARAAERAAMQDLADAVRLAVDAGMSENQASKVAGVTRATVSKWVKR